MRFAPRHAAREVAEAQRGAGVTRARARGEMVGRARGHGAGHLQWASLRALVARRDSRVPEGSVTGPGARGQRALDGARPLMHAFVERALVAAAGRQRCGDEQRKDRTIFGS